MPKGFKFRAVRVHTLAFPPEISKKLDSLVAKDRRTATEIVTTAVRRYLEEQVPMDSVEPESPEEETFSF